jgi:hypothetical protein
VQSPGAPSADFNDLVDGEIEAIDPRTGVRCGSVTPKNGRFFREIGRLSGGLMLFGGNPVGLVVGLHRPARAGPGGGACNVSTRITFRRGSRRIRRSRVTPRHG